MDLLVENPQVTLRSSKSVACIHPPSEYVPSSLNILLGGWVYKLVSYMSLPP